MAEGSGIEGWHQCREGGTEIGERKGGKGEGIRTEGKWKGWGRGLREIEKRVVSMRDRKGT